MKYTVILYIVFFTLSGKFSSAQTNVNGEITSNTTWDLAGSPYIVQSDVTVDTLITLTIEAGVTVKFDAGTSLGVNGTIRAIGSALNEISFGADTIGNPVDFYWSGIYISNVGVPYDFTNQSGCFFQYCKFNYSGTPNLHVDPS